MNVMFLEPTKGLNNNFFLSQNEKMKKMHSFLLSFWLRGQENTIFSSEDALEKIIFVLRGIIGKSPKGGTEE